MLETYLDLLHRQRFGALATFSEAAPGFPFVSALPYAPDARHGPVFFVSALAEHTRNLLHNPNASLLLVDASHPDVLTAPRATLIGTVEPIPRDHRLERRYLRYQPAAEQYIGFPDFQFLRLRTERVRWVAGFGRMGWLTGDELDSPDFAADRLESLIETAQAQPPEGIRLLGLDPWGIDYERDGERGRESFRAAADSAEQATSALHRWLASLG